MTPEERKVLEEAENQAFETATALYSPLSRGVRPEPKITQTESVLGEDPFRFEQEKPIPFSSTGATAGCA